MPAASAPRPAARRPRWFRSFYWRIALGFTALVVIVLVGQSLMFSYLLTRQQGAFTPGDPNTQATAIAAEVSRALAAPILALRSRGSSTTTPRARVKASIC